VWDILHSRKKGIEFGKDVSRNNNHDTPQGIHQLRDPVFLHFFFGFNPNSDRTPGLRKMLNS
jgi:hypothetical protein